MKHPFAENLGLILDESSPGRSQCSLVVDPEQHLNPHGVAHGAVLYAMADTGMGMALYPTLETGQLCATIEIKISYFKPVFGGRLICQTEMLNRGKTVANLESRLYLEGVLVAQANGNYAIFRASLS